MIVKFDKKRIFSLICGALFVLQGVYCSIQWVGNIVEYTERYGEVNPYMFCSLAYAVLGVLLGLLVALWQKIPLLIGALAARFVVAVVGTVLMATEEALVVFVLLPDYLIENPIFIDGSLRSLALFFSDIAFSIGLCMMHKNRIKNKLLCFTPLFISVVAFIPTIYEFSPTNTFLYLFSLFTPPYLFLTLWMTTLILPETEDAPISESLFGDADRIEEYKRLLDDGVITEEEYERIKRQILSLK